MCDTPEVSGSTISMAGTVLYTHRGGTGGGVGGAQDEQSAPATKAIAKEHVEDLLSVKAIAPKALGGASALPTDACCPLLIPIPVIRGSVVRVAQAAERLGDSCMATKQPSTAARRGRGKK